MRMARYVLGKAGSNKLKLVAPHNPCLYDIVSRQEVEDWEDKNFFAHDADEKIRLSNLYWENKHSAPGSFPDSLKPLGLAKHALRSLQAAVYGIMGMQFKLQDWNIYRTHLKADIDRDQVSIRFRENQMRIADAERKAAANEAAGGKSEAKAAEVPKSDRQLRGTSQLPPSP
jgi:hypothetical protein